ncbi:bifunctional UDP-sugar hydrolase/5'-nucleotidase [Paenibacillus sp.]|uniref:bifunctional metallophosphatase/5'-nucleotidase n=1 Tax=Paenibacillus sp. TaxID=58172 RepID=UPI00356544B8
MIKNETIVKRPPLCDSRQVACITKERVRLRILHTNDIHSHFDQMPRIAEWIKRLKENTGEAHTLTLDIGDHLDRMRSETEGTEGLANIAVINATGYDAVTLGNNEGLTYTPDVLDRLYGEVARFPVVLGNMVAARTGTAPAWMKPWHIVEKAGLRIGLIGATAAFPLFYKLLGWEISDPYDTIRQAVEELRPQTDIIVLLSHLGLRHDEKIAEDIPGIDVILGGHTHHLLTEPLSVGSTWICAAGKHGQYVGVVDLAYERQTKRLELVGAGVHATAEMNGDPELQAVIDLYANQANETLSREVVRLDRDMPIDWYGESPLGNLLAAGLRRWVDAEIGLVNAGQLLGGPQQGPVSAGTLLKLCPSPINPCRLKLTGAQLRQALEESLLPEFMDKPLFGFGFRGKVLGTLCLDGLSVEFDPEGAPYSKIVSVRVGESPMIDDRLYTVGTIDMFTFGIGYLSIGQGIEPEFFLPEFLRDVLLHELRNAKALQDSSRGRWIKRQKHVGN